MLGKENKAKFPVKFTLLWINQCTIFSWFFRLFSNMIYIHTYTFIARFCIVYWMINALPCIQSYITREIPAFGGISLALRGSGASGAHLGDRCLWRRWKNEKKEIGAPDAPQMVLKTWPVPWGFQICAWFWNWTTGKMNRIIDRQTDGQNHTAIHYRISI